MGHYFLDILYIVFLFAFSNQRFSSSLDRTLSLHNLSAYNFLAIFLKEWKISL